MIIAGALGVALIIRAFLIQSFYIPSPSMVPTLKVKDRVLVNKLSYHLHSIHRGDIVVFRRPKHGVDPNIKDLILYRQVLSPKDIEDVFGLTEGNIFQGELTLEQLFWSRPVPGYARFRTPVRNLWLCGSSTHPGGGIMGAPGRLAAAEVIRGDRWTRVAG